MPHLTRDPDDPALSERLDTLLCTAEPLLDSRPAEALAVAGEACALARDLDDDFRLSVGLRVVGDAHRIRSEYQAALAAYLEAVALAPPDVPEVQAGLWQRAADAQTRMGNDREALEYLGVALRLARESHDHHLEFLVLEDLAMLHHETGDDERALQFLTAQLDRATTGMDATTDADPRRFARILARIGQVQLRLALRGGADLGAARATLEGAVGAARRAHDEHLHAVALNRLAQTLCALNDTPQARRHAMDAWTILARLGDRHEQAESLHLLGRIARQDGRPHEALRLLERALNALAPLGAREDTASLHLSLSEVHEDLGQHEHALRHHRLYHALESERWSEATERRSTAARSRLDLQRSRHEARVHQERGAELEALVHERTAQLASAHHEMLDLLASCAEFRSRPLGPHTRWVGETSGGVALTLGLPPAEASTIGLAARLHDLGKIAVPDHVLLKAGPLTPDEWVVMRAHTTLGAQLLGTSESPLLRLAGEIARTHHERWDGQGYPEGLSGEDIPIGGRIVNVVDTFDALVTARSYKHAWSVADAVAYLRDGAGTRFDPAVVAAFVELCESGMLPSREPPSPLS